MNSELDIEPSTYQKSKNDSMEEGHSKNNPNKPIYTHWNERDSKQNSKRQAIELYTNSAIFPFWVRILVSWQVE